MSSPTTDKTVAPIAIGLSLMAAVTLMLELSLIRAFDVMLTANLAYMVISCALLGFGLAGIVVVMRPLPSREPVRPVLARLAVLYAGGAVLLIPALNALPFDLDAVMSEPGQQVLAFLGMYAVLVAPFFASGLIFAIVFSQFTRNIQTLYCWDLVGAAVGCVLVIPLVRPIGPAGILLCAAGGALFGAACFSVRPRRQLLAVAGGLLCVGFPFLYAPRYLDFREHMEKRGVKQARQEQRVEVTVWDPVSKIDVIDVPSAGNKHIAYDGGQQSSTFYPFHGDFARLRASLLKDPTVTRLHFWGPGVVASHLLKRDRGQRVLVIGSAGGQETKAALTFGAARVDAVEMVDALIELGQTRYASYTGNLFRDPRVRVHRGEGRSFLRATPERYDIIQIYSNHTSSSIAAGNQAIGPVYLQTVEAYREYFRHLRPDGILHVNHHVYPRMITTAAEAWRLEGRRAFQRHVVVFEQGSVDNLPTVLIKMTPWTAAEVQELERFFAGRSTFPTEPYRLVEDPLRAERSFLGAEFYQGRLPDSLSDRLAYRVSAVTDDKPYFNLLRKQIRRLEPDPVGYLNGSTAHFLNIQLRKFNVPMDLLHVMVVGLMGLIFAAVFILVPLNFSLAGRAAWPGKRAALAYFSCLGAGFIMLEVGLIQILEKLVGFPLYTFATVLFAMLLGAGVGSLLSGRWHLEAGKRWVLPFAGILIVGALILAGHDAVASATLAGPLGLRILVAGLLVFPLGFFLGMPFPLGMLALADRPRGAVAWAWGMNGLLTVIGSLVVVIVSASLGFRASLSIALAIYLLAAGLLARMRNSSLPPLTVRPPPRLSA